jgi:hypothetical protein
MRGPLRRREYVRGRTGNSRKLIGVFKRAETRLRIQNPRFRTRSAPILQKRGKADCQCSAPSYGLTEGDCELVKRFVGWGKPSPLPVGEAAG